MYNFIHTIIPHNESSNLESPKCLGTRDKIGLNFLGVASIWSQVHTSRLDSKDAAGRIMNL